MATTRNNQYDMRTRLIAFLIVLAVGFVMGWINGRGDASEGATTSKAAQEQTADRQEQAAPQDESADTSTSQGAQDVDADEQDVPAPTDEKSDDSGSATVAPERGPTVKKDGWYTSKDEVALYIHTYGRLPGNFISKTKARNKGWVASEGNLDEVCPGMSIGGSRYYNDDGELPDKRGRTWTECDINYTGGYRGAERIVFSNDGLIFYTADHYETFEQLY